MSIQVINLRHWSGPVDFKCDRTTVLGNPYKMRADRPDDREAVIEMYYAHFHENLNPDVAPPGFLEYLDEILQAAKVRDITLGCWCAPQACHCDVIKEYVETEIRRSKIRLEDYTGEFPSYRLPESIEDILLHLMAQTHEKEEDRWADLIQYMYRLETSHDVMLQKHRESQTKKCCGGCHGSDG